MPKLSDTQSILLTAAAQRESYSLLPIPATITVPPAAVTKSLGALVKQGLAEERETRDADAVHRTHDDVRYGLFATRAGLAAIGISEGDEEGNAASNASATPEPEAAPAPARITKSALVTGLLRRESGATLAELIAATGWLPHTTRAALTGLRNKGLCVERTKRDGDTCYRITDAA